MNPQFVVDEVVTANKMNQLPKGVIGVAQATTTQASIGTSDTDLTGLSVTVTLVAGRRIRITGHIRTSVSNAGRTTLRVKEGATELNSSVMYHGVTAAAGQMQHTTITLLAPSTGAHTYKLTLAAETGTCSMVAATTQPCSITVEDVGGTA